MRKSILLSLVSAFLFLSVAHLQAAAKPDAIPSISDFLKSSQLRKTNGLLPLYWDEKSGALYLHVPHLDQEMLYISSLPHGVGVNDMGLDRGQYIDSEIGQGRIVRFHRIGRRVFLIQSNYGFRSSSGELVERKAVEEAFAESILAGFDVVAEEGSAAVLIDVSQFMLTDNHEVAGSLKRSSPSLTLDLNRSAIVYPGGVHGFPRNTDVDVMLTFASSDSVGALVGGVAPSVTSVTCTERHSFIALPESGYEPRRFDPRAGFFELQYEDYAVPIGAPVTQRFIARHRLKKKDPTATISEPVEPIVYYVDRAAPQIIRDALKDGGSWWNQAFEAAGYRNAFRVEALPEGVDPLDMRYNVVEWVTRSTRGWSYGQSIADPRTGEIIRGHVLLDALRARYDYLMAEGLLSPYGDDRKIPPDMQKLVTARLRQLAAHEIGHTLGLRHNFIASTQGRASVMDYPPPLIKLTADGSIDLSDAYATGIGAWDKVAIAYGYSDFADGTDTTKALNEILANARTQGLWYLTDDDATAGAHPEVTRWDSGANAVAELDRMMEIRRRALAHFGKHTVRIGAPLATMEEAFVPLFLLHRFQAQAAARALGGVRFQYTLRDVDDIPPVRVPAKEQQESLAALLRTLNFAELTVPAEVLAQLPPRPPYYDATPELFSRFTGRTFDAVTPPTIAADLTISELLASDRAARLVQQHALDASLPGFEVIVDALIAKVFDQPAKGTYEAEIQRACEMTVVTRLLNLAGGAGNVMPQVQAVANYRLHLLRQRAEQLHSAPIDAERSCSLRIAQEIQRFEERHYDAKQTAPALPQPGGAPLSP